MTKSPSTRRADAADDDVSPWHVYMVRCADASLYTGIACDLQARLAAHNAGRGARYTRTRRPVVLVYQEPAATRAAALRRERQIKRLRRRYKLRLLRGR